MDVSKIVNEVCNHFRVFGGGEVVPANHNPIAHALKDEKPMFAAGVDVENVVRFVLEQQNTKTPPQTQTEDKPIDLQQIVPISLTLEEWYVITTRLSGIPLTAEGREVLINAAKKMARALEASVGISENA